MVLSLEQIKDLVKNPANRTAIDDAAYHENRIKFHTKAVDKPNKASAYYTDFLKWVQNDIRLPADKFSVFKGMLRFPVATNALCDSVFTEYEDIFTAQDSYFEVHMASDTAKERFMKYLSDSKIRETFREKALDHYRKNFASLFVVDLPAVQSSDIPQAYYYRVPITSVLDVSVKQERIEYVIFKRSDGRIVCIDDVTYRLFEETDKKDLTLLVEAPHGLGYTPATFLSHTPLYDEEDNSPVARKIMLSGVAADLDWLLFYKVAERMYETYGPFPIFTIPETDCDYTDAQGNQCSNGIIANSLGGSNPCPACSVNSLVGPGSVFSKPVPKQSGDPDLKNAVDITPPDIDSLEYISKKIDYLEWEIYANCVGSDDDLITKEAVNEDQVSQGVEGKRKVLLRIKKDFERTEQFIIDTMGRLMYGEGYEGSTVNYGDEFLLLNADQIAKQYKDIKVSGLPNYMVAAKKSLLIQTEHRNNPYELRRAELLNMLEPWPEMSHTEIIQFGYMNAYPEKFLIKVNFANFISTFELANGDIVTWGSALSLETKVQKLNEILLSYGREQHAQAREPEPAKPGGPDR